MKMQDVLFKETLMRVGHDEMIGITRLINDGHNGIAEKHTVSKLLMYVRKLEKQLGIDIPKADELPQKSNMLKINSYGGTYFATKSA